MQANVIAGYGGDGARPRWYNREHPQHVPCGGPLDSSPGEVTQLLHELRDGNEQAENLLIPIVFNQLRKIASALMRRENAPHTLQPTALVNEAYIKLTGMQEVDWQGRTHFFKVSAMLMRRVLIDHARKKNAEKRGLGLDAVTFDEALLAQPKLHIDLLGLDEALTRLAHISKRNADVVEMRFFAGMTEDEIAVALGISVRTVKRDWEFARAWLYDELSCKPKH